MTHDICLTSKSKVSHLIFSILDQYIGRLDISMNESLLSHLLESQHQIFIHLHALVFTEAVVGQFLPQISITQLKYDIGVDVSYFVAKHLNGMLRTDL